MGSKEVKFKKSPKHDSDNVNHLSLSTKQSNNQKANPEVIKEMEDEEDDPEEDNPSSRKGEITNYF